MSTLRIHLRVHDISSDKEASDSTEAGAIPGRQKFEQSGRQKQHTDLVSSEHGR